MKLIFKVLVVFVQALLIASTEHEGKFLFRRQQKHRDVKFFLYTRENAYTGQELIYGDENLLYKSNINPSVPTRFLLHGWNGDMDTPFNEQVTIEFLMKDDVNVIRVDWSELARSVNYFTAANRVPDAGMILGQFIDFLHFYNAIDFNKIKIVGFSLGAQVAGFAGKNVQRGKVHTIIALDPAGPSFAHRNSDGRLDSTDAVYVEVIHTNMGMTGMTHAIGHADFIANSGIHQPGCLLASCSHQRAPEFYIESINQSNFFARECPNFTAINRGGCQGEVAIMGDPSNAERNLRGIFHFTTNKSSPFARAVLI